MHLPSAFFAATYPRACGARTFSSQAYFAPGQSTVVQSASRLFGRRHLPPRPLCAEPYTSGANVRTAGSVWMRVKVAIEIRKDSRHGGSLAFCHSRKDVMNIIVRAERNLPKA